MSVELNSYRGDSLRLFLACQKSSDSILITDTYGIIEFVNDRFCEVTGYKHEEVVGKTPSILKSGYHSDEFYREFWNTIKQQESETIFEFINKRKNSEMFVEKKKVIPFRENNKITHYISIGSLSSFQVANSSGEAEGVVNILSFDVDDSVVSEAYKQTEQKFSSLIDLIPDILIIVKDSKIEFINKPGYKKLGYKNKKDLLGRDISTLFCNGYFYDYNTINKSKKTLFFESCIKSKDGEIPIEVSLCGFNYNGGRAFYILCHDISERKKIENALIKKSKELEILNNNLEKKVQESIMEATKNEILSSAIFDSSMLGLSLTNASGIYLKVNKAYADMLGYTQEELIRKNRKMVVAPELMDKLEEIDREFMSDEFKDFQGEYPLLKKNNERLNAYITYSKIFDSTGEPIRLATIIDITEVKKMEEKHKAQERLLIQQSKLASMGEMIGAIAHQWRQPLTAISAAVGSMSLKKQLDRLDDDYFYSTINSVENHTQKMSKIIDDFMNYFKPDKKRSDFRICDVVENIKNMLHAQLKNRNIELITEVDNSIVYFGFANEFEQVLLNIVINARDSFEKKDIENKYIKIYTSKYSEKVDIVVEDSGGGIEDGLIDRIFEPYFTTKEQGKGTGIGLYMSSMIVERSFKGSIRCENIYENDKKIGARFIIALTY
ncbi:MAG: PAS domain S-box protein [Campylobacterales bacterium]